MADFKQGDVLKISGGKNLYIIVSNNAFNKATGFLQVCPYLDKAAPGPLHIQVAGVNGHRGFAICEQIKLIDPSIRFCSKVDHGLAEQLMNLQDALQGLFEYSL